MKTSGNTVLITGAVSSIGLEIAPLFGQCHNEVIIVGRSAGPLETEAANLTNSIAISANLADRDELRKLIQKIKLDFPG